MGNRTRRAMLSVAGAVLLVPALAAGGPVDADAAPQQAVASQGLMTHRIPLMGITKDGQNPPSQPSFVSSATAVVSGGHVMITARVRSSLNITAVFDVETIGPAGQRVDQQYQDNLTFKSGVEQTLSFSWTPPPGSAPGTYTVRVGVFEPGREWSTLYHWNDEAVRFVLP